MTLWIRSSVENSNEGETLSVDAGLRLKRKQGSDPGGDRLSAMRAAVKDVREKGVCLDSLEKSRLCKEDAGGQAFASVGEDGSVRCFPGFELFGYRPLLSVVALGSAIPEMRCRL